MFDEANPVLTRAEGWMLQWRTEKYGDPNSQPRSRAPNLVGRN
jgi:hypothetical protein